MLFRSSHDTQDMFSCESTDPEEIVDKLKENQTLNLLYVAITRAKYQLSLPQTIVELFHNKEELKEIW